MKKISLLTLLVLCCGMVMAQKVVSEQSVPAKFVEDFQRQNLDVRNVKWYQLDSTTFEVRFIGNNNELQSVRYKPVGTERCYFVDLQYCPRAIKDTVRHHYSKYKITEVSIVSVRRESSYEVRIAQVKSFLFLKKEKDVRYLLFKPNGEFIKEK